MTTREKLKHCVGCRENFYNGNNSLGVKECWGLESAKLMWRKEVGVSQQPPWNQGATRVLSCYRKKGYVYVGKDQTH